MAAERAEPHRGRMTDEMNKPRAPSQVIGVTAKVIFPLLHRPATLRGGDLRLSVAALRVDGQKSEDITARCATGVA